MARRIRFGVTLPQIKRTWQEARDAALTFDRLGYGLPRYGVEGILRLKIRRGTVVIEVDALSFRAPLALHGGHLSSCPPELLPARP